MRTTDNQILLTIVQHKLKDKKGVWIQLTEYATLVPGVGYLILSIPIGLADLWVIATYTCCYRLLLLYILTAALLMILAQVLVGVVSYLQKNTMCKWSAVFCRSRCSVGFLLLKLANCKEYCCCKTTVNLLLYTNLKSRSTSPKIHLRATASRSTCFWCVLAQPVSLQCHISMCAKPLSNKYWGKQILLPTEHFQLTVATSIGTLCSKSSVNSIDCNSLKQKGQIILLTILWVLNELVTWLLLCPSTMQ